MTAPTGSCPTYSQAHSDVLYRRLVTDGCGRSMGRESFQWSNCFIVEPKECRPVRCPVDKSSMTAHQPFASPRQRPLAASHLSASSAAMHPVPAEVMACR